jgi:putative glutamine amidotransferase
VPKPLIGIVCGLHQKEENSLYGLRPVYPNAISMAGGLPVLVMPGLSAPALREIFERLDGLMLAGGGDVAPERYGMIDNGLIADVDPVRDAAEINLVKWAYADDKPLLGICRGCQVANVALGGTLYRDIRAEYPGFNGVAHTLPEGFPRDHYTHSVTVVSQSRLAGALGQSTNLPVNSLHHQALREIAAPLKISATAEDGLVEGVEIPGAHFFVAVQWHPEELTERSQAMRRLFESFVEAIQAR